MGDSQYRWREQYRTSERCSFFQFSEPAPWLDPNDVADAEKRNSRSRYLRLYWGQAASGLGDAIDDEDITACIRHKSPMLEAEKGWSFLGGLDLGTKHDHSAFVVLGVDSLRNRVRLASVLRWKPINGRINLDHVRMAVLAGHRNFRLMKVFFDPDQAMLMAEDLQRWGVVMEEMRSTGRNLNTMATAIMESFRGRTLEIYSDAGFVADLRKLKIVEKAYGYKLEASSDSAGHADAAFACALCLPAAVELAASGYAGDPTDCVPRAFAHPDIAPQRHGVQVSSLSAGSAGSVVRAVRFDRNRNPLYPR